KKNSMLPNNTLMRHNHPYAYPKKLRQNKRIFLHRVRAYSYRYLFKIIATIHFLKKTHIML
ncbi:TPA: hypothetical protein ACQ30S_004088, partial [Yersinia enterocolitica]